VSLSALIEKFRGVALDRVEKMNGLVTSLQREHDEQTLDELLRETHTLKGEARMMSFADVNLVSHLTEQVAIEGLQALPRREDAFDVLHFGLDILRTLLTKSAGEAPADLTGFVDRMIAWRHGGAEVPEFKRPRTLETPALDARALRVRGSSTIRVEFEQLEALSSLSGELNLSVRQVAHQFRVTHHLMRELQQDVERAVSLLPRSHAAALNASRHRLDLGVQELEHEAQETLSRAAILEEEVQELRHVRIAEVLSHYPRAIRGLAQENGKKINFIHDFGDVHVDRGIIGGLSDPLLHLVRNAVDHGIESPSARIEAGKPEEGEIRLICQNLGNALRLVVQDDGAGMDVVFLKEIAVERGLLTQPEAQKLSDAQAFSLIFEPGFTTRGQASDLSGRGIGMDVVMRKIIEYGGQIQVESKPGKGTSIELLIPTLSTMNTVLIVSSSDVPAALLVQDVARVEVPEGEHDPNTMDLADLFDLPAARPAHIIVLRNGQTLGVERVFGERQALIRPLGAFLEGATLCRGMALTDTGESVPLLNSKMLSAGSRSTEMKARRSAKVLVIDDSDVTRALLRSILRGAGYHVLEARDGQMAQFVVEDSQPDLIICDLQMPVMDGLEFLKWLRQHPRYAALPAFMLTTQANPGDEMRAREAGANVFMGKLEFDESQLLGKVRTFIEGKRT